MIGKGDYLEPSMMTHWVLADRISSNPAVDVSAYTILL